MTAAAACPVGRFIGLRSIEMTRAIRWPALAIIISAIAVGPARAAADEQGPASLRAEAGFTDPSPARPVPISRIELKDGQTLHGRVVEQDEKNVTIEMPVGGRIVIERALIKEIKPEAKARVMPSGQVWMPNANRDRYLLIPSAMMLKQGEFYFSQTQLFLSTMTVGLIDHLTLVAGGVLPLWFVHDGFNFVAGLKAGFSVGEYLHLAGGAQTLVIPGEGGTTVGFFYGTTTVGTGDANVSVAAGAPFAIYRRDSELGKVIVIASGNLRLTRGLALVTENWIITRPATYYSSNNLDVVLSLAARAFGEQWAVDVGALRIPSADFPVPWVNFTYHWNW